MYPLARMARPSVLRAFQGVASTQGPLCATGARRHLGEPQRRMPWADDAGFELPSWATADPFAMSASSPAEAMNLVGGRWQTARETKKIIDPLNGEEFVVVPATASDELGPFVDAAMACPKYGLHNPLYNPQRYVLYGEIAGRAAAMMADPSVEEFFARMIQRVTPKHIEQCRGEIRTVRRWLSTFSGDGVRNLGRSFAVPGDHFGQESRGYRWPYGRVAVITPFNFPLEIPALQTLSALFMGNRPMLKVDEKVSIVIEQFVRMLIECGMPSTDMDLLYSSGPVANELLLRSKIRMLLFTGSQHVAEKLCTDLHGRVKLEDAGFDWKILGPDVKDVDYVAWQSDQDAYAFSGQKCSAQSIMFMHKNWSEYGFVERMRELATRRSLANLTISPVLTVTNKQMSDHVERLLEMPGSRVLFGGKPISEEHSIPECYGSFEPTAVFVPIEQIMASEENFKAATTEIFGPFQVVTEYTDDQLEMLLESLEKMSQHLTGAIVSDEPSFVWTVMGRTVNGTTYVGARSRTTGAPANHWFGPSGDPRAGGIHTVEAIQATWSGHREIICDRVVPKDWLYPGQT